MKRLCSLLLIGLLMVGLAGCKAKGYSPERNSEYVTPGDYKGLTYQAADEEITDYRLTLARNRHLNDHGYAETNVVNLTEGTVRISDNIEYAYDGRIDGKAFDGGSGEDSLVIGSDAFLPGFEEGLIGTEIGSTVTLDLIFPKDYHNEELAGKDVTFEVTVKKVIGRVAYAPLTDAVAIKMGYTSRLDFEAQLRKEVAADLRADAEQKRADTLWAQAVDNATFLQDLPLDLMETAINEWTRKYKASAVQLGYDTIEEYMEANDLGNYYGVRAKETREMVENRLVAQAIADAEGFSLTDALFEERAAAFAAKAGYSDTKKYIDAIGKDIVNDQILLDYARNVVVENAIETK